MFIMACYAAGKLDKWKSRYQQKRQYKIDCIWNIEMAIEE